MAYIRRKNKAPWGEHPRALRKLACIRLKNEIAAHAPFLGGAYTTHDVVVDASWADIYFLSNARRGDLYNATVDTALYAYFTRCDELAGEASERALPYQHLGMRELFEKLPSGNYAMRDAPESHVEAERRAFDGLTRYQWIDKEAARLADSGDVWVHPRVEIDRSYSYGVGLMATLPTDILSISDLDRFVRDFWARGERPFAVESSPISYPSSRRSESRSSNAVEAHPSEWVPADVAAAARHSSAARGEKASLAEALGGASEASEAPGAPRPRL